MHSSISFTNISSDPFVITASDLSNFFIISSTKGLSSAVILLIFVIVLGPHAITGKRNTPLNLFSNLFSKPMFVYLIRITFHPAMILQVFYFAFHTVIPSLSMFM